MFQGVCFACDLVLVNCAYFICDVHNNLPSFYEFHNCYPKQQDLDIKWIRKPLAYSTKVGSVSHFFIHCFHLVCVKVLFPTVARLQIVCRVYSKHFRSLLSLVVCCLLAFRKQDI